MNYFDPRCEFQTSTIARGLSAASARPPCSPSSSGRTLARPSFSGPWRGPAACRSHSTVENEPCQSMRTIIRFGSCGNVCAPLTTPDGSRERAGGGRDPCTVGPLTHRPRVSGPPCLHVCRLAWPRGEQASLTPRGTGRRPLGKAFVKDSPESTRAEYGV